MCSDFSCVRRASACIVLCWRFLARACVCGGNSCRDVKAFSTCSRDCHVFVTRVHFTENKVALIRLRNITPPRRHRVGKLMMDVRCQGLLCLSSGIAETRDRSGTLCAVPAALYRYMLETTPKLGLVYSSTDIVSVEGCVRVLGPSSVSSLAS